MFSLEQTVVQYELETYTGLVWVILAYVSNVSYIFEVVSLAWGLYGLYKLVEVNESLYIALYGLYTYGVHS